MINRGTTRPEMDHHKDRMEMMQSHHEQTLWIYWSLIILGFWLIFTPLTFNFNVGIVEPSGGREVWLSLEDRITFLKYSDMISGFLLIFLGFRSLKANRPVSLWAACFVGVWLSFAPILFWAPTAVSYYNDTFIGMLIMALTVLIPGMPNMINYMEMGTSKPPGWSYNPSSWSQRWILIVLGFLGWMVSRYLAAYQLGYIDEVWDPFFGDSTRKVLDSDMSHSLPISDAGLGSLAYTLEFLMGFMGSPARWRTMPWMVTLFGILVIPLGLVHIFLVISQPVVVGLWCSFCLLAALIMLPMIPLEFDEVIAMVQFMKRKVKSGEGFWKVFWKGGSEEEDKSPVKHPEKMPKLYSFSDRPSGIVTSSLWGMNFPLPLCLCVFLGIIFVGLPTIFGTTGTLQKILQVAGLLLVTNSVISMGETLRPLRFLNIPLAIIAGASGIILSSESGLTLTSAVVSVIAIIASVPRCEITHSFGNWDKFLRW